jgi:hypothetical protein
VEDHQILFARAVDLGELFDADQGRGVQRIILVGRPLLRRCGRTYPRGTASEKPWGRFPICPGRAREGFADAFIAEPGHALS